MNDAVAAPIVQDVPIPVDVGNSTSNIAGTNVAPNPEQSQIPVAKAERPSLEQTIRNAAEKATKLAEAKATEAAKPAAERSADGKFQPKTDPKVADVSPQTKATDVAAPKLTAEGQPERPTASRYEAPQRFNEAARKEWETSPESVRAEVSRVLKENEDGIAKYKASHEGWERVKSFDDIAKQNGRAGIHESLKQINDMENTFARNPIDGFKAVADHFNLDLHKVASVILGQDPNEAVGAVHKQLQEARAELAQLKLKMEAPSIVDQFADSVGRDKFEENADKIAKLLETGIVDSLDKAWAMVSIFGHSGSDPRHTASDATNSQPLTQAQTTIAQTDVAAQIQPNPAGQKSVTGAPTSGTVKIPSTTKKATPDNLEETLKNAFNKAGVRMS